MTKPNRTIPAMARFLRAGVSKEISPSLRRPVENYIRKAVTNWPGDPTRIATALGVSLQVFQKLRSTTPWLRDMSAAHSSLGKPSRAQPKRRK